MDNYEKPILELVEIEAADIICASGGMQYGGWSGDNDTEWKEV